MVTANFFFFHSLSPWKYVFRESQLVIVNLYRNSLTWSLLGSADSTTEICCNCNSGENLQPLVALHFNQVKKKS